MFSSPKTATICILDFFLSFEQAIFFFFERVHLLTWAKFLFQEDFFFEKAFLVCYCLEQFFYSVLGLLELKKIMLISLFRNFPFLINSVL